MLKKILNEKKKQIVNNKNLNKNIKKNKNDNLSIEKNSKKINEQII